MEVAEDRQESLTKIAHKAAEVTGKLADASIRVSGVSLRLEQDSQALARLSGISSTVSACQADIARAAARAADVIGQTRDDLNTSSSQLEGSLSQVDALVTAVGAFETKLTGVRRALTRAIEASAQISQIAGLTRMLAGNASLEAARSVAGSSATGRGEFDVVAAEFKNLSQQLTGATGELEQALEFLNNRANSLFQRCAAGVARAEAVRRGSETIRRVLEVASHATDGLEEHNQQTQELASDVQFECEDGAASLQTLVDGIRSSNAKMTQARDQMERLLHITEELLGDTADLGVETIHTPFINLAQAGADEVARLLERALSQGKLGLADLFDENYRMVPGTNPQQYLTRFTPFADQILPAVQEETLRQRPQVVFCVSVDRNGYLPTHNYRFSHPQGHDPQWNAAHCRNRRIFNDAVGLAAARNRRPFLVQSYRRDMGGGQFLWMNDVSAPIVVSGRHWGALRVAYKEVT